MRKQVLHAVAFCAWAASAAALALDQPLPGTAPLAGTSYLPAACEEYEIFEFDLGNTFNYSDPIV